MGKVDHMAFNAVAGLNPFTIIAKRQLPQLYTGISTGKVHIWTGMERHQWQHGARQLAGSAEVRSYWSVVSGFC